MSTKKFVIAGCSSSKKQCFIIAGTTKMRDLTIIVLEVPKYSLIAVLSVSYGKRIKWARFSIHGFTSICNMCVSCVFAMKILTGPQNCIM
jgi:hypothetical protein